MIGNHEAAHPTGDRLAAFALGRLDDSEAAAAADHLGGCETCQQAIRAVPDDSMLALLRPGGSTISLPSHTPSGGADSPNGPSPSPGGALPFTRLGHYRVVERIGRGGMGDVYLGYEDALQRQVAIKVLPAELARDNDFVRRFHDEATAVAKLTHPNIVPIYFSGQDAGYHFFVMQYVEGESLDRLLVRKGRLGVEEALGVLEQCLAGLGAAHRAGLVHRDVKPGNVLLEAESGRALVADFGLVKVANAQRGVTVTGAVMGTVDYIPPEQARGEEVDGRSDLYSVGVMAYHMLSGRLPFEAKTPTAMLFQHAYETPKPLGEAAPDAPQALAALVDRLMAKDPAARYQRCEAAAADLRLFRAGAQAVALTPRPSQIVAAPDWEPPPALPLRLEAASPWQRLRERLLDWFQARTPGLVQRLQNTEQQVDGAVAEYQRRRDRLAGLVGEAAEAAGELAAQARSHREAAAAAASVREKEECERVAADLDAQAAEQQGHLARMRAQMVQVDATLGRLRRQSELLQARLRVAAARQRMEGGVARPYRLRRLAVAAGLGLLFLVAVGLFFALSSSRPQVKPDAKGEVDVPATAPAKITNSIGMKLKLIQPGTFTMGSPKNEEGPSDIEGPPRSDSHIEGPQHEVEITKPFRLGVYPVTKGQFAAFVEAETYQTQAESDGMGGWGYNAHTKNFEHGPNYSWRDPGFTQTDDHPVVDVTWNDAQAFCTWLSRKEGKTYELPTEAEWEYACRAGTKTRFWCGDADASLKGNENVADASLKAKVDSMRTPWMTYASYDDGYPFTSPVGKFKPNPWGLYDMSGNVYQWCADRYGKYQERFIKDPKGADGGDARVERGGSWGRWPMECRSAFRVGGAPAGRDSSLGFRVVLRLPASQQLQQVGDVGGAVPPAAAVVGDDVTNSIGMKLKLIKPGTFAMGSPKEEDGHEDNERPQHEVEITKAFYMGVHPVTVRQFRDFVSDIDNKTDAGKHAGTALNLATAQWETKPEYTWRHPGFPQEDDHPVVQVSWNDATAFCAWLSKKEGKTYELPTEAEWEYACRAGTTTRFWCGDTDASLYDNANIADASLKGKLDSEATKNWMFAPWDDGYALTSPVGIFKANPWGLHDMMGNVWQWCADEIEPYQHGSIKDPKGKDRVNNRIIRGGSWRAEPRDCRSARRYAYMAFQNDGSIGFRVVLRRTWLR